MSALDEVKKVIDRIEQLKPQWTAQRTAIRIDPYPEEVPEKFREGGITIHYTTLDGIKIKIYKAADCMSFSSRWRDHTVFCWFFEISVRTEKEVIYEHQFSNSRKIGNYDPYVCECLDEYLKKVGLPILLAEEERRTREWKQREAKRIAEEKDKPPPPLSAKDKFWNP